MSTIAVPASPTFVQPALIGLATAALVILSACTGKTDPTQGPAPPTGAALLRPAAAPVGNPPPVILSNPPAAEPAPAADPAMPKAAPAGVERVTVIGIRPTDSRFERAQHFVQTRLATARSGQLARWMEPVCPLTVGLSPEHGSFVSSRVETLAGLAKAPGPTEAGCRPNIEIVFTDEPQKFADELAETAKGAYLGYHYLSQTEALKTVSRPIQAWYLTATRSSALGGGLVGARLSGPVGTDGILSSARGEIGSAGDGLDIEGRRPPAGCPGSHFSHCITSSFANVVIVADRRALANRPLGPIADYIAVLAISHMNSLDECSDLPSILDLLAARCGDRPAPTSWTPADLAYLAGLYATDLGVELTFEKNSIVDHIAAQDPPTAATGSP